MRMIAATCLALLFFYYFNKDKEVERIGQLNHRIISLEAKIDSLIVGRNVNCIGLYNKNSINGSAYNTFRKSIRCQAITKKGTQCRRKAKTNIYCWQHAALIAND